MLFRPGPAAAIRTPREIASRYPGDSARYIGRKKRYAGCGGVVWLSADRLFTLNLLGNTLGAYAFDPDSPSLRLVDQPPLEGLCFPENLELSPDRKLLAISNSRDGSLGFYRVDAARGLVEPRPLLSYRSGSDRNVHGVCFSRTRNRVYVSTVDSPGCFRVLEWAMTADGGLEVREIQKLENALAPLKPKGISVSREDRFLAIAYGANASAKRRRARGQLEVRGLNEDGSIQSSPLSVLTDGAKLGCAEDVAFFPDDRDLLVTDQDRNRVAVVGFDPESGQLGEVKSWLGNPRARLRFPHGCAVSPDGRYFAVANYGSDAVTIYATGTR
ncbi:MAG TPA: hypothetical protein VM534_03970 [Thermoanaerobaculia bacterium]|nr:hypothetical protein [Thermoanaerobaculia bacterium]